MLNAEILADIRTHRADIERCCNPLTTEVKNAMMDRLIRDMGITKELVQTSKGIPHCNYDSVCMLQKAIIALP